MVSRDEGEVTEKGIITLKGKKMMISNNVQEKEDLRLFKNDYSRIREEGIKHDIKLQWLGIVQKGELTKEFKALLQSSFIYHVEDLKCVSPIVVVPKNND